MNGFIKEEVKRDLCRGHSARSDRAELYRVCPSKLSKKELEDLYFSLLENNLDLKKTINSQQDKIKVLSTKVQRLTASQKNNLVRDAKDNPCCAYTKAMINEQKESIADLKKSNERMAERIRVLNMRLCSAKQFLRRSPVTSTSRCTKFSAPMSLKNSTISLINAKTSDSNVKSAAVSSQCLDKDIFLSTRTVETGTEDQEKENQENLCNENRCQSLMEELKQKIVNLQEELSKTHEEYSSRISRLESEVSDLRGENSCVRVQRAADEQELRRRAEQAERLLARLRTAEGQYGELAAELSIEKRKVAELETRVKAVDMSCNVVKTIEEHLSNSNLVKNEIENQQLSTSSPYFSPRWDKSSSRLEIPSETRGHPSDAADKAEQTKQSDDSGYSPKEEGATGCINDQLNLRINVLQQQLDSLKLSAMNASPKQNHKSSGHQASKTLFLEESASARPQPAPPAVSVASSGPVDDSLKNASYNNSQYSPALIANNVEPERDDAKGTPEIRPSAEEAKAQDAGELVALENLDIPLDSVSVNTALDNRVIKDNRADLAFGYQLNRNQAKDEYDSNLDQKTLAKTQNTKTDTHNSMQIPGPMPVDDNVTNIPSKYTDRLKRRQRNTGNKNKRNQGPKNRKDDSVSRGNAKKPESVDTGLLQFDDENRDKATEERSTTGPCVTPMRADTENEVIQVESVGTSGPRGPDTKKRCKSVDDYIEPVESSIPIRNLRDKNGGASAGKASELTLTGKFMYDDSSCTANPSMFIEPNTARPAQAASQTAVDAPIELCGRYARLCTCPATRRRDVSVFRTCSGTLRFRTRPSLPMTLKQCPCPVNQEDIKRSKSEDTQTDVDPPSCEDGLRRRSQTYSKGQGQQTYSVSPRSPENTDHEISSLTDLPSEIDAKSPREVLSPGEERATNTYTDSYSAPTTECGTLSEGELPGAGGAQRLSNGEAKVNFREAEKPMRAAQRMEEALAAITQELALCRELLQARHASERPLSKDECLTTAACPGPIALKRASASPRIGKTFTPKCIFTLHIGTVVLSDEAVINSRDMSLVLTWKFYDQNVTMARVRAGRVVLFDFSTEYDVKITDQFLSYLKHDEMQLMICELEKPNEPFASCALPLREALLHTNRRADMSLALVAGPRLRAARALRDALDGGDEVGVLDLWCMLRVEPALLPAVNRAIATTRLSNEPPLSNLLPNMSCNTQTQYLEQVMDDDRSDVENLSTDLDMHLKRTKKHSIYDYDRRPVPDTQSVFSQTLTVPPMSEPASELEQTLQNQRSQVGFKDAETQSLSSQIIVNEVLTKIRSASDMKQALDQNLDQNNLPPIATLGNLEEDAASQTHSTGSSWRGLVTRRLIPKTRGRNSTSKNDEPKSEDRRRSEERNRSFPSFLQKNSRMSSWARSKDIPQKKMHNSLDIEEPPELTRGLRNQNSSKKSVKYTDTAWDNKQQHGRHSSDAGNGEYIGITVEWLALSEECEAMMNPSVQRLYVAYSFLGRGGADLETPVSLPKPTNYAEKCYFHFSRTFQLTEYDLPLLGHMARCRSTKNTNHDPKDCVVFTVISEPPEDPLGLDNCEDIGFAYLYLGDLLAYCAGSDSYSEVIPVLSARAGEAVCGVLAVRVDGLGVARRCVRKNER